ncbi:MAG TPA: 2-phospho-L-lactate transferase [Chloroflexota bacterium]|nr:2-phospho-L-lactate transferase [Chloroflexota bacterium]
MITALCGGVGGSKLALGLHRTLPPDSLTVIVNVADDTEFFGLRVSPDLDTVLYTLAGVAGPRGWGIAGDTFAALEQLERYGAPGWFKVGDRDLATDIVRTDGLRQGRRLTEITGDFARALGVRARILPASDGQPETALRVGDEWLPFQEYFVHRAHNVPVEEIQYRNLDAGTTPEVLAALRDSDLIVIVNSNPVLSILPILAFTRVRQAIERRSVPCVAVSPMVGQNSVAGPAGELMRLVGQPATSTGVASIYHGLIDGIVIDRSDEGQVGAIRGMGVAVRCTDTVMRSDADKERLAGETLAFAAELR